MVYRRTRGPAAAREREEYRLRQSLYRQARPQHEKLLGRPSDEEVDELWRILGADEFAQMAALESPNRSAAVVVIDQIIDAADRGSLVTFNRLFDAVARKWSDHFRAHRARSAYDMTPTTLTFVWRDFHHEGIRFDKVYQAVCAWSESAEPEANPLFRLHTAKNGTQTLKRATTKDAELCGRVRTVLASRASRPAGHRILLVGDEVSAAPRADDPLVCCDDLPYDVVPIGPLGEATIEIQEQATLLFDASRFKEDYRKTESELGHLRREIEERVVADPPLWALPSGQRGEDGRIWSVRSEALFNHSVAVGLETVGACSRPRTDPHATCVRRFERSFNDMTNASGSCAISVRCPSGSRLTKEWFRFATNSTCC
jgi:hypothetical protein